MWYVIQTLTGKEMDVSACINLYVDHSLYKRCFVPLYEDVWKKGGEGHISIKRMFSSYVFVETDSPVELYKALKSFPRLTIMLYTMGEDEKAFLSIYPEEESFFDNILSDGIMRVSYVHSDKRGKLDMVIGPLRSYTDNILKVDLPHRRAIVEIPMLGDKKTVKFGLWMDRDEKIPWIEEAKKNPAVSGIAPIKAGPAVDLKAGDKVICIRGLYGDAPLEVAEVRPKKGTVVVKVPMFGSVTNVEMSVDDVVPS